MSVLVDTSVWIEFFSKRPAIDLKPLGLLISEHQVVTCLPVQAEILSGEMTGAVRVLVSHAFDGMIFVDADWNLREVWNKVAGLAAACRKERLGLPGIVDRMILLSAQESGSQLWTLDRGLTGLAQVSEVPLFNPISPES